jgi:hypothetical protein
MGQDRQAHPIPRRQFLSAFPGCAAAAAAVAALGRAGRAQPASASDRSGPSDAGPFFLTRGVVVVLGDLRTLDWPERARRAGLTTVSTHIFPHEVAAYIQSDDGRRFLEACRKRGVQVEHELHAMSDLVPRALFDKDPAMFPMNDRGDRVRDFNLCVHSPVAIRVACENVQKYARVLRSTTGRYFYWIDDGQPMCRCPKCRGLSDSDQALLLEHHLLDAIRAVDARASLAHLAYARTLQPPTQIGPRPGIFLEFAPIERRYDVPFRRREARGFGGVTHGKLLDALDANLAWFGREGAQALEYWLDLSRFSGWKRENVKPLPWNEEVFVDDLKTYSERGVRHVTTFAAWIDGDYVKRFGDPPIDKYGAGLLNGGSVSEGKREKRGKGERQE